ncbi:Porin [Kingella kingae]|uniref:porin n=1 Tax=Kingella kingae TaxID=504 RepID=UPI000DF9D04A|nr:porin [Kingella kingae]QIP48085.1 porin [Kingella kingae]STR02055.1 Porin [Kingella kingae]
MKKTLIAVALATLSATSMADVILYGKIKGGFEVTKIKDVSGTESKIVDYGSRIGFKGHEELNAGLKAIWQLEQKVNIGGKSTGFGTRNSFIGLEGGFGRLTVGYQHNPVGDFAGNLDQWSYDSGAAGLSVFTRGTAINKRRVSAYYTSPDFGGFSLGAYVSPSDNNSTDSSDKAVYAASLRYKHASGFFADVLGGMAHKSAVNGKDGYQIVAQAGYDAAPWFAGVAYQTTRGVNLDDYADAYKSQEVAASFAYDVSDALKAKASAVYGFGFKNVDGAKLFNNGKYYQAVIGADYALSKRTVANAQVGAIRAKNAAGENKTVGTLSVGMGHAF